MSLTERTKTYKPFQYPEFVELAEISEKSHWIEQEIDLVEDVRQWKDGTVTEAEKHLVIEIMKTFTQCYSCDTEILTVRGWVYFKNLTSEDLVAQVTDQQEIEFVAPTHIHSSEYEGDMHHIKDGLGYINLLVTPNHKIVTKYKDQWRHQRADEVVFWQGVKLLRAGNKQGMLKELTPYERLMVAFQADGNVKIDTDGTKLGYINHYFSFTKKRKYNRLMKILTEGDFKYVEHHKDNYYNIKVQLPHKLEKEFAWVQLEDVSTNWALDFLDEARHWDGHTDEWGRHRYYNTRKEAIDVVQALCVLANIHFALYKREENRKECHKDGYIISYSFEQDSSVDGQAIRRNSEIVEYKGEVYCVTVPSGRIVVRRQYGVAICGNSDTEVASGYVETFMPYFKNNEVRMMLLSIAAREGIHQRGYALFADTIGLPEEQYGVFLEYEKLAKRMELMTVMDSSTKQGMAKALARTVISEGVALFGAFAMLLNFQRQGKLMGLSKINEWSIIDEALHVDGMVLLFRKFLQENPEIIGDELKASIYSMFEEAAALEMYFIDRAFEACPEGLEGLKAEEMKEYIKYIADRRLIELGLKGIWNVRDNPLPWLDAIISGSTMTNFFEQRVADYSAAGLTGEWCWDD